MEAEDERAHERSRERETILRLDESGTTTLHRKNQNCFMRNRISIEQLSLVFISPLPLRVFSRVASDF